MVEQDQNLRVKKISRNRKKSASLDGDEKKDEQANFYASTAGFVVLYLLLYLMHSLISKNEDVLLAKQRFIYEKKGEIVECDPEYLKDVIKYSGCKPKQCGRYITDTLITPEEVDVIFKLVRKAMAVEGSNGPSTLLDLHTGALSYEDTYRNIYTGNNPFKLTQGQLDIYKNVRFKLRRTIADTFGLDENILHLTFPSFFIRTVNKTAISVRDEYWHVHVDKLTYSSFHYTSMLYFNGYGINFRGGRLIFANKEDQMKFNFTVEPRKGRVAFFTSGAENPHFIEKVTEGVRFALCIPFSCDPDKKLDDPNNRKNSYKYLQQHFKDKLGN